MSGYRLRNSGCLIDRSVPHTFTFDNSNFSGFAGDTLASALLAEGVTLFARSFKYHRPRGVVSAGAEEPSALVSLRSGNRTEPNTKATLVELFSGLNADSQNNWPTLNFDLMAVNGLLSPFFVAGFYYKTFIGTGQRTWHFFEPLIRRAAGMGKGTHLPDPDRYDRVFEFCDVLVVGGGPAGLMAAETAAQTGARVVIADENATMGGSVYEDVGQVDDGSPIEWFHGVLARLKALPNVTVVPRMTVYGYFDGNTLGGVERKSDHLAAAPKGHPRQRHWTIHADKVVIATGSVERPMVFAGNDLPGVMLAGAAHRYANRYGVSVGREVIVFTNNDSGYHSAYGMADAGVNVTHIVDARPAGRVGAGISSLSDKHPIEVIHGAVVERARGRKAVSRVTVSDYDMESESLTGNSRDLKCDSLVVSGGWTPSVHLCSQAGSSPVYDDHLTAFLPGEPSQDWFAAGAVTGKMSLQSAISSGQEVGRMAVGMSGTGKTKLQSPKLTGAAEIAVPSPVWEVPVAKGKGKKFVDLQHDVTVDDVKLAQREGFESVEHLKRYTTLGMAADQGKTSNVNGLAIMAKARGISIGEVGTTRFRPPYTPVTLGALVGRDQDSHLRPTRRTPMHDLHEQAGAEMISAGAWVRPRIYGKPGETVEQAYIREMKCVREGVGMIDVSTLGKIDVQGPDATEFLNRVYSNGFAKLPIKKARYGLMLREDGFVFDDGTTWRLSDDHYLMTTTTAHAAQVLANLEYLLTIVWPSLKVHVCSVTDQWAAMAVAGPKSRDVLSKVVTGIELGNEYFPFMNVGRGEIDGSSILISRLSFSGELAYEVYCGWFDGESVWNSIMEAGQEFGIVSYGLEAMGALRIEKGHVSTPELDGRTTANDLGLGGMVSTKKNFVGSAMIDREALNDPDRMVLVGLQSLDNGSIHAGSQLVEIGEKESIGHVTSVTYSPSCKQYIALGLLQRGRERMGANLVAADPLRNHETRVEVVDTCFVDKKGERLHV